MALSPPAAAGWPGGIVAGHRPAYLAATTFRRSLTLSSILLGASLSIGCLLGALFGLWLRPRLAEPHLDSEARGVVANITALMSAMAALLLGLLVASAQDAYRTVGDEVDVLAANLVALDRAMKQYGPEADPARVALKALWTAEVDRIWPRERKPNLQAVLIMPPTQPTVAAADGGGALMNFAALVHRLQPQTGAEQYLQREMLDLMQENARTRVLIASQATNDLPTPIIVVIAFWLVTLFLAFGMLARTNPVVMITLLIGAASVGGALFVVLELNRPFSGIMSLDDRAMRQALASIGQ
jgi:Protein of unknown function (DUF4239)